MSDPWETVVEQPPPSPRGFSPGAIAALATALLVLAVAGLAIGWFVAGQDGDKNVSQEPGPSPTAAASATPSAEPATATPTASAVPTTVTTTSAVPAVTTMPDLTVLNFRDARVQVQALKMSVTLTFGETGDTDGKVVRTEPKTGDPIKSGMNVKIFVVGEPPTFAMPEVAGLSCDKAKTTVLAAGLIIGRYPTGTRGLAWSTTPLAGTTVAWNGRVEIICSTRSPAPANIP